MANIAQLVNVLQALILTEGDKMLLTPTYHVFDMYQVHHDATFLPVDVTTDTRSRRPSPFPRSAPPRPATPRAACTSAW